MQSKVILTVSAVLIVLPAVYFFFFEFVRLPLPQRFWGSLFQAVTPRTAGFNTLELTALSETGQMLTCLLMLTGGSPGSTAGGMILSRVENLPLVTCLFESASAVGTVGLTLGITPSLGMVSRGILILLMFFGRVGGLTLIFAALSGVQRNVSKLPREKITVG